MVVEHPALPVETVLIADLTPHAQNYRAHPADQLAHLVQSIKDHGFYRNVVISRDGTILAGHGVVEAARSIGLDAVPAIRLDLDANDPRALAVLIRDNEIAKLAEPDDAALAMLLATIQADGEPIDTLGIGADELGRLLALVDGRAVDPDHLVDEWRGMPEFEHDDLTAQRTIQVHFADDDAVRAFASLVGQPITPATKSIWYPESGRIRYGEVHAS